MKRFRIIHVINSLEYGGAETRLLAAIPRIAGHGHSVAVVCLMSPGTLSDPLRECGVPVYGLSCKSVLGLPWAAIRLCVLFHRLRPDLVHSHLVHASLIARVAARLLNIKKLVTTQHNAFYPKEATCLYRIEYSTWNISVVMIAISYAVKRYLIEKGCRRPIVVIPTGIDADHAMQVSDGAARQFDAPYVISVGHLRNEQKGHDVFLRAFARVRRNLPSLKAVVVGDGAQRAELLRLATTLGIANDVYMLGTRPDVLALMRHSELFVLASRWEGFGRVLIEAMALGKTVIATTVEGIPEVVRHGETGLLVPPNDDISLAAAMIELLRDDTQRRAYGRNAQEVVRRDFGLDTMVSSILRVYDEVMDCH